jgi:hypothetical protein
MKQATRHAAAAVQQQQQKLLLKACGSMKDQSLSMQ